MLCLHRPIRSRQNRGNLSQGGTASPSTETRGCPGSPAEPRTPLLMLILCVMPKRCHSPWRAGSDPIRTRGQAWSTEWAARYPQPSLSCPRGSPTGTTSTVFSNTVSQKQGIVGEHHSVCCCREADGAAAGTAPQEFSSPHRDRAAEGQETSEEA